MALDDFSGEMVAIAEVERANGVLLALERNRENTSAVLCP